MSETPTEQRIRIMPDGPYLVMGAVPLTERYPAESRHGEPLAWDPVGAPEEMVAPRATYALCRCGQSGPKPFCDGTHARVGFDGTVTAERTPSAARRRTLVGTGIVMTDEPELCVHAGFYGTRLTNAWEMIERTGDPEVRARGGDDRPLSLGPPAAGPGRGGSAGRARLYPSIATIPDGPLWVRGGIPVEGPGGQLYAVRNRVTLCRCGPSHNKPFCDGTHKEVGFRSPRRDHRRA